MGPFHTILADPPWEERGGGKICRGAQRHYDLMTTDEILAYLRQIPISQDAHLYLWATNNFLKNWLEVMDRLGFRYITNLAWVKDRAGLGQYFRGQHELLLFGVRGRLPYKQNGEKRNFIPTIINAPRREHSRKPDEQYQIIESTSYPPYIEAFARIKREGWEVIGNEAPGAIHLEGPNIEDNIDTIQAQNGQVK